MLASLSPTGLGYVTVGCTARKQGRWPSCSATRRHCHARAAFLSRVCMLCGHTLLGSTMRPSCMHHTNGSYPKIVHSCTERPFHSGPRRRAVALLELRRPDTLCHGIQRHPTVRQRTRECDHGCQKSRTPGQARFPPSSAPVLRSLTCIRFAKHDAICDRDCCSCVSLSPVTATP